MKLHIAILVLFSSACLLCLQMFGNLNPSIAAENGLMENTQLILVLIASAILLLQLRGANHDLRNVFYCGISFGLVCTVRETDVRQLNVPRWVELLTTSLGYDIIIGSLCLTIVFFAVKAGISMKRKALQIPCVPFGMLSIAAGVAMLIGDIFDKKFLGGDRAQMYEEYFETIGYFLLLTAALSAGSLRRISGMAQETP